MLFVPSDRYPFFVDNIVTLSASRAHSRGRCFARVCVTIILKIVAEVDLLIPLSVSADTSVREFAENICDSSSRYPSSAQLDSRIGAGGSHCHR